MEILRLKYNEQQVKETMRAYFRKKIGITLPIVLGLMSAFVVYRILQGDRTWYVGLVGATVVFAIILLLTSYVVHLRRSQTRLRMMKSPEATMKISPEQFRIESDLGATEMKWKNVTEVQCFSSAWLLFFSGNDFLTLPLEGLSEESKQLILSAVKANGARIT